MTKVIKQNRIYKGIIEGDYIYYDYIQRKTLKDGTVKEYPSKLKRKRDLKKLGKNPNKKKSVKGGVMGRPITKKGEIKKLIIKLDDIDKQKILDFIKNNILINN